MYWNPEIETLDVGSIAKIQSRKLRAMLRMVYRYHPHYKPLLRSRGVDIDDVSETEDLRRLPFTTQEELAADPESFVLPAPGERKRGRLSGRMQVYYDALIDGNMSDRKVYEYHPVIAFESLGFRTPSYRIYMAAYDKAIFKELCGRAAVCAGLSKADRVLNTHHSGRGISFWSTVQGSLSRGACCSSPGQPGPEDDARTCSRLRPTVVAGSPLYLYYVARAAERLDVSLSSLEKVFLSGCPADAQLRGQLADQLKRAGATPDFVGHYAVTEARHHMVECTPGSGFHTASDIHVWECVDPVTGEQVGPGESGELVFTSVDGRGSVFLRYRTGDIAKGGIVHEKCPHCGRTTSRIVGPLSRVVAGYDPSQVARALIGVEGISRATVHRVWQGTRARIVLDVVPEPGEGEGLVERVALACKAEDGLFTVRVEQRFP